MAAQPSGLVQEQDQLASDVEQATEQLAQLDLCAFWGSHKDDVIKWAHRLQKFPYSTLGFVRNMGRFIEQLAPKIDAMCGD